MSLNDLHERVGSVNDVLCALSLLIWDSRTMMPTGGTVTRSAQIATLTRIARDLLLSPDMRRALEGAQREVDGRKSDDPGRRSVEQTASAIAFHERIPTDLLERKAAQRAISNAAWIEAREKSDFSIFEPHLIRTVNLAREYTDAAGWDAHPYDALIAVFEPGETYASLRALFAELRPGLKMILDRALGRPRPRTDFLSRAFPEDRQRALALLPEEFEPGQLQILSEAVEGVHLTRLRPDGLGKAGTDRDKIMVGRRLRSGHGRACVT